MKMRVIMCPVDRAPYVTWIEDSLENLQRTVGGYIECFTFAKDAAIICNEEGRMMGLPENKSLPLSGFRGDCFVCGVDGESLVSLGDEPKKMLLHWCRKRWEKAQRGLKGESTEM